MMLYSHVVFWLIFPFYHGLFLYFVSLSITDSCLRSIKKGLVIETPLALIYILPYYFHISYFFHVPYFFDLIYHIFTDISYDVIVIFYIYLTQTNLLLFNIPTKFMINKKKTFFGGDLCVLYVMLWKFFSKMPFCNVLQVVAKKKFLVINCGKRQSNFPISRKTRQF